MKILTYLPTYLLTFLLINVTVFGQTTPSFNLNSLDDIQPYLDNAVSTNSVSYFEVVSNVDFFLTSQPNVTPNPLAAATGVPVSNSNDEEDGTLARYSRWKNYWQNRVDSKGSFNAGAKAMRDFVISGIYDLCENEETNSFEWQNLGPSNNNGAKYVSPTSTDKKQNQGRFDCVAIDPYNHNIILAGTRNGGIFKTVDGGQNWYNTTDEEGLSAIGMMDISFHPTNSNYVVAVTGNKQKQTSYGFGLIESYDAGETWTLIPQTNTSNTVISSENYYFTDVRIDPRSIVGGHMRIYAMTQDELWVYDNMATTPWNRLYDGPWAGFTTSGFTDFEFIISDNDKFYFVSRNKLFFCNYTWANPNAIIPTQEVTSNLILANVPSAFSTIKQMRLHIDNSSRLFVALALTDGTTTKKFINNALYGTTEIFSWNANEIISTSLTGDVEFESFEINKNNPNFMYAKFGTQSGHPDFARSVDGGLSWTQLSDWINVSVYSPSMHADIRYIKIYKSTYTGLDEVYVCTDGGIQKSIDGLNFVGINGEGLSVAEYYKGMAVDQSTKDDVLLGAQDNSINFYKDEEWIETSPGGDNFACLINRNGPKIYHQISNHTYYRMNSNFILNSIFGTSNFTQYNASSDQFKGFSLEMSPTNQNRLMIGQYDVYFNNNNGQGSFTPIPTSITNPPTYYTKKTEIDALKISKSNPNISYYSRRGGFFDWNNVGIFNDIVGGVFKLTEGPPGTFTQINVTNNLSILDYTQYSPSTKDNYDQPLLNAGITDISIDPKNANRVWVTFTGFKDNAKVWFTEDGGGSWQNADPNLSLPNFPVNAIQYQEGTNDRIYIGTDVGVFYKDNDMPDWCRYADLPAVNVTDVDINYCTQTLYASTWCRGLWEAPLLIDKLTDFISVNTNQTWTGELNIASNISIQSNKTLIIDGATLNMPKNARIIVNKNAQLRLINGAKITNACGEMWEGIAVDGVSANNQPTYDNVIAGTTYNQGVLIMNNATLEHAKEAVRLHVMNDLPNTPYNTNFNGGVVFAKECHFINNRRSAEFMKYNADASESKFTDCEFITNDDYRLEEYAPHHISMWDNHGIKIVSCTFDDQRAGIEVDDDRKATGIFTIDANFTSRGVCNGVELNNPNMDCNGTILPNKFLNLKRGIHAETTGELSAAIQIYSNLFENCYRGISLRSVDNIVMAKNDFNSTTIFPRKAGIYMEATDHYTFTKNNFNNIFQATVMLNTGFHLNNTIYKNNYSKDYTSMVFGVQTTYNNDKLTLDCNNFEDQLYDIYATTADLQGNISLGNQGTLSKPVANTFKNSYLGNYNGYLSAVNTNTDNYTYYGFNNQNSLYYTPQFGTTPAILINSVTKTISNDRCADKELGFIVGKNSEGGLGLDGYHSILNNLNYSNPEDAVVIDNAVHILTLHYLSTNQKDKVITLLSQFSDKWHQVQLASYYTLDGKYDLSKIILNPLIAQNTDIEVKELARVYFIKNELERSGKSWFEMNALEKNTISSFARRSDFSPATVKSRNILNLTDGIFFEEEIKEPDFDYSVYETETEALKPEMKQYPNPLIGTLNLEYTGFIDGFFKVEIYNLLDNTNVYSGNMPNTTFSLDVSAWSSGFYSIVVTDQQGQLVYKSKTKIKN